MFNVLLRCRQCPSDPGASPIGRKFARRIKLTAAGADRAVRLEKAAASVESINQVEHFPGLGIPNVDSGIV
jgi:hypothetical protein